MYNSMLMYLYSSMLSYMYGNMLRYWYMYSSMLKVHMHEIFIVCFQNYFCIFQSLINTKHSTANIFEKILKIRPDIRSFRSLAVFAESAKHGWALSPKMQS